MPALGLQLFRAFLKRILQVGQIHSFKFILGSELDSELGNGGMEDRGPKGAGFFPTSYEAWGALL